MRLQSGDLVFLLDLSGGMAECIDSVKSGCCVILNEIQARSKQSYPDSTSWRFKVCGYRNYALNSENWFVDNPFVSDLAAAEAQFSGSNMQAAGGCEEEAVSLLDALFRISKIEQTEDGVPECSSKWRARGRFGRAILFITNSTFNVSMSIPEAAGGGVRDAKTVLSMSKVRLHGLCPEWEGYCELGSANGAQTNFVASLDEAPALVGFGTSSEWRNAKQIATEAFLNIDQEKYRDFGISVVENFAKRVRLET